MFFLILVGVPGAGKSTLSKRFSAFGWRHINQDELGDRQACEDAVRAALRAGQHVVIDRCNIDYTQRAQWVRLAHECGPGRVTLVALQLLLPLELCKQRARCRVGHPNLGAHNCDEVIDSFAQDFEEPTPYEGFGRVITARSSEEAERAAEQLLAEAGPVAAAQPPLQPMLQSPQQEPFFPNGFAGGFQGAVQFAQQQQQQQQQQMYVQQQQQQMYMQQHFYQQQQQQQQLVQMQQVYSGWGGQYGNYAQHGSYAQYGNGYAAMQGFGGAAAGFPQQPGHGFGHNGAYGNADTSGQAGLPYAFQGAIRAAGAMAGTGGDGSGSGGGGRAPIPMPPPPPSASLLAQAAGGARCGGGGHGGTGPRPLMHTGAGGQGSTHGSEAAQAQQGPPESGGQEPQHEQPRADSAAACDQGDEGTGDGNAAGGLRRYQHHHYGSGGGGGGDGRHHRRQEWQPRDSHRDIVQRLRRKFADPSSKTPYDLPTEPDAVADPRVILLFDLNGTLTCHTSVRKAQGVTKLRPGTEHLVRLREHFRLGIYTSSTLRTVQTAMEMLEQAAGGELFERGLVLHREHTQPAPAGHLDAGGNAWDTLKPLGRYFSRLDRVLLVDDDAYKSIAGEEANMLLVPCWQEHDVGCCVLRSLSELLLARVRTAAQPEETEQEADVRRWTAALSAQLHGSAAAAASPAAEDDAGGRGSCGAQEETPASTSASPTPPVDDGAGGDGDGGDEGKGKGEEAGEGEGAEPRSRKRQRVSHGDASTDPAEISLG
ncbi:hypothetical protein PLESTB_000111500 [Pleodorina starrii]|uniref:FCP1 homology domain-containing protein n=1 Tax=Pleodorina starrii TaxID=330485 RepID=A0A9W6BBE9_9CHLO|nr:hypothetical protein PLESTM_000106900 [Pleodorina starrii]GLC48562.1 hypothetical protein PLESTB_000111500 [Pleodorina starrii]GLC71882.1 hypothetical protein PLESTF_001177100 [Pleodorina starrii]